MDCFSLLAPSESVLDPFPVARDCGRSAADLYGLSGACGRLHDERVLAENLLNCFIRSTSGLSSCQEDCLSTGCFRGPEFGTGKVGQTSNGESGGVLSQLNVSGGRGGTGGGEVSSLALSDDWQLDDPKLPFRLESFTFRDTSQLAVAATGSVLHDPARSSSSVRATFGLSGWSMVMTRSSLITLQLYRM